MNSEMFTGVGVAVVTPFNTDGSVDFNALKKLINWLIEEKIDYLVALGTTSESATLSADEKKQVLDVFIETMEGRIPLVMGLGGNNTAQLVETLKMGIPKEIDALLSVCPYYNKPNQRGLEAHFSALAEATDKPIILYNVPGRTASNITAESVITLANKYDHIIGIKEASGNLEQAMEIIAGTDPNFLVISGEDSLTYPLMALGAKGAISVTAQGFPQQYVDMVHFTLSGLFDLAKTKHYELLPISQAIFKEGNPAGIKYVLNKLGFGSNTLRLPLVSISSTLAKEIDKLMV